ncbi:MAG: winged helix-turn-helix domain-containing protein [Rhodomicrobium sp.]
MRYLFEDFTLDVDQRELRRGLDPVRVEPKVFDLLCYIVRHRERVVSRDDLIEAVWAGRIVSESTLTSCINAARGALADCGSQQRIIRTVPRKGIRFIAAVHEEQSASSPALSSLPHLLDKASITVLPFRAEVSDSELGSFADGLTEDVITALSRVQGTWVIARNTMLAYRGRSIDERTVAKELGVRYVLGGNIRRAQGRVRVKAELVEAETGHHIWSAKLDRPDGDLFDLQEDFAQCMVASVQTQITVSEGKAAARKAYPSARIGDLLARARERLYQPTAEGLHDLIALAETALALDPQNSEACRLIATGHWHLAYFGDIPWNREIADKVMSFARRAVLADNADEYAHWMLGLAHLMAGEHERALASLRRALEVNPSCSLAYGSTGTVLAWQGASDLSIANNDIALRMNPGDPTNYHRYFGMALAHYLASRYESALKYASMATQMRPGWWLALMIYAAILAQLGQNAEATAVHGELQALRPNISIAVLNTLPFARDEDRKHVAEGLRKAEFSENPYRSG